MPLARSRLAALAVTVCGAVGLLGAVPAVAETAAAAATAPVTPVASVDLARYLGHWYQVAAIPAIYELQCSGDSQATYAARPDGTVDVRNTCATYFGFPSTVDGVAKVDNAPANSALSVSFVNLGTPIYFGGSNYLIFGLDRDYRWALVGDPSHGSGFVLSRTPALAAADLATIRSIIVANGYRLSAFHYTPQTGGSPSSAPLG